MWHKKYPSNLHDILLKVFRNNFFEYKNTDFNLIADCSSDKKCKAELKLTIENNSHVLVIDKIEGKAYPYLKHHSCADKVVIELFEDNKYDIHIFEFSKTRESKLKDLPRQFEGAYLRTLSFLSFFSDILQKQNVYFHLVFETTKESKTIKKPVTKSPIIEYKKHTLDFSDSLLLSLKYTDIPLKLSDKVNLNDIKS